MQISKALTGLSVMHGVSLLQLSEKLVKVIFKTELNPNEKVNAIPGCCHGKYFFILFVFFFFTAFRGASKGLLGHVPVVMCTAKWIGEAATAA